MMRRRFLPFFPFPKPLPLLDIHDPRYFSLVSTHKYASPTEKFPCPARLDDGRAVWSGPCARVSGSWRGFWAQAHDAARKYLFDGREGSSNPLALQRNLAEPQGVGDDGDGTEAHRDANIGSRERRRIIEAITRHRHHTPLPAQLFDDLALSPWRHFGLNLAYFQLCGDHRSRFLPVPRKHHDPQTFLAQRIDGLP